ncbi:MAG TPA: SUMF1/EgtB/PvdO family nonheme iron enzyme [Ferruginibacter sp.]|nr:SUMF1/EgtB/PvdO family nonheme iron enzyme [Ferruginibacter sp.]
MSQVRQLAAIMFADIVGYTALMHDNESNALMLRDKMKLQLDAVLKLHHGRLIKFSGDGALCSFDSAAACVRAAVALQLEMQQQPKVPMRIGIHQADTVFEENDVFGDGVNIASRLESLAVPGSIFISAKVYDDIKNQNDIQTASLGKYALKNVKEPVEIFAISNAGLIVPHNIKLEGKGEKYKERKSQKSKVTGLVKIAAAVAALILSWFFLLNPWMKKQHAKNDLLPAIEKLVNDNFAPPTEAFDMALEAEKYIPNDSALINLWPTLSHNLSMATMPAGAELWWKDYDKPNSEWRLAGTTPFKDVRLPRPYLRMEIRKKGYQTIEYAGIALSFKNWKDSSRLILDKEGTLPVNMVRIPAKNTPMYIVGLESNGGKDVPSFLMDKYEVSNKEYKAFMDAGGYSNKKYWGNSISQNGKEIPVDAAWLLFTDKTGRPGPANWEAGTYPDGQENYPVTGISWYEAAAYALYAQKKLPTVFHWSVVAETSRTQFIVALSNFNGKNTTAIGSNAGYSSFGIYDIAGNAREWCSNSNETKEAHYILGGGWNDPTYAFNDSYLAPAMDRSVANGFRCIKQLPGDTAMAQLMKPVSMAFRDYTKEKPVDDKTFEIYKQQFAYDKTALNEKIETTVENESWTAQKITFDAGYNNERVQAWLYLPKGFKPPYQTVLFFPGSNDIYSKTYNPLQVNGRIDFILKSGRAIMQPIYKGTCERHDELKSDLPDETVFYKDHLIMWRKDIGRSIDYLETRKDIQADKLGYLGWSWGGYMGGIMPAVEKRLKVMVLNVGGMVMNKSLPEADQVNYLPRVTQPVLMLNGKHDLFFPVETSQKPMYDFLGTPAADKKRIVYDAGHLVPRTDFVKETLLWYDKYLGAVR